jgi:hypothetical protein
MKTKLTLTIEKSIIEQGKLYAQSTGTSLSELIENYLETFSPSREFEELPPKLRKIAGVVRLPADFDEESEIREYLEKKHR